MAGGKLPQANQHTEEPGLAQSAAKQKEMVLRIFKRGDDQLDEYRNSLRKLTTNMFG